MPQFKYKAIDARGRTIHGQIDAINDLDLETRLETMGLEFINASPVNTQRLFLGRQKVTRRELITFFLHLEQLNRAGVSILEALADLCDATAKPRFKEVVSALISSIEGGKTLSQAMEEHPRVFHDIFVHLVQAGEYSGNLTQVLHNIAEILKWQDELAAHLKKLTVYPAIVGSVVTGVIFFLMIYLVPQLVMFIQGMDHEIPTHTKVLIAVSDLLREYWYFVFVIPIAAFIFFKLLSRTSPRAKLFFDSMKLRLWPTGPILKKIILSRFSSNFALLYSSGITVISCIDISKKIVGNVAIVKALDEVSKHISEGHSLSESIGAAKLFPPLLLRMLKVGENTGKIDEALLNVSYFFDRDVKESLDRVQAMIEPVITLILGVILGWVMLSVLGPVYDMIGQISA